VAAVVTAIDYHLPASRLSNEQLVALFPGRSAGEIEDKTGVAERRLAGAGECASDLAFEAAKKLFEERGCSPADIDFLLFCTQSADYFLPATACLLQHRLGLPLTAGALDFNLGCSGFVYGLALAKGLVETGQAARVLLITADTYSKFLDPYDRSVRIIFGDAACATLIEATDREGKEPGIGPFVFGTDGSGATNLIVCEGGLRAKAQCQADGSLPGGATATLHMNGPAIVEFTIHAVPEAVRKLLAATALRIQDVDLFVFHQASKFILERLRRILEIPDHKYYVSMSDCGNTVSSTIPIALKRASDEGRLRPGQRIVITGFGVGYSWAAALLTWRGLAVSGLRS
jgi:3-oxoacyl-[acyl-carrier-protein] synthase-3